MTSDPGSQGFKIKQFKGSAERDEMLASLRSKESIKMDSEKRPVEHNSDLKLKDVDPRNCMSDNRQKEVFFTPLNAIIEQPFTEPRQFHDNLDGGVQA